jgi:hypothetical protein
MQRGIGGQTMDPKDRKLYSEAERTGWTWDATLSIQCRDGKKYSYRCTLRDTDEGAGLWTAADWVNEDEPIAYQDEEGGWWLTGDYVNCSWTITMR